MAGATLNLDREDFLTNYWQRKPLLIRNAVSDFKPPLDADELAGLALEEDVESRIIECRDRDWAVYHGPFHAADFQRSRPWTLLVQAVDHYSEDVARLRSLVDFIPQWRVDDVMISYATAGGGVGPHYDNYDVFLLQGQGTRTWKLGQQCDSDTELQPNADLRILEDFDQQAQYSLSAGDILYVPPGVAHWGIAENDCMTYSIGFRAPRLNELISRRVDAILEQADPEVFYRDPPRTGNIRPGEIDSLDLRTAKDLVAEALSQKFDDRWFGELLTEPKYEFEYEADGKIPSLGELCAGEKFLCLRPSVKIAWQQKESEVVVFANGASFNVANTVLPWIISLCDQRHLDGPALDSALGSPEGQLFLQRLLDGGSFEIDR